MRFNKEEGKRYMRRIISIVVLLSAMIILSVVSVSAQQTGCCEITKPAAGEAVQYCQNGWEKDNCNGDFHSLIQCSDAENIDNINTCKLGTMVCPSGCTAGKTYAEAMNTPDCYWEDESDIENVDKCKEGCCSIPSDIVCEVKSKIVCENEANDINCAEGKCDFDLSVKDDSSCSNMCDLKEKGACKIESGNCVFTTKEGCINKLSEKDMTLQQGVNFFTNTYVSQVTACGTSYHDHLACGDYEKDRVYWFDNENNQEDEVYNCGGSNYVCEICNSDNCTELNQGSGYTSPSGTIDKNEPYCKYAGCDVNLKYGGQKWDESQKRFVVAYPNKEATILNYRSICYNFFTGHPGYYDNQWNDDDEMKEQMEALKGISTGLQNSKIVCERGEAKIQGFGEDRKTIGIESGTTCIGQTNDYSNCLECGKNGADWMGDLISIGIWDWGLAESVSDQCSKEECESAGDCVWRVDVSTPQSEVGSCTPKYPIGTTELCGQCGEGGDALFNLCNRDECCSLGNCRFETATTATDIGTILVQWPMIYYSERVNMILPECTVEAIVAAIGWIVPGNAPCIAACGGDCSKCLKCLPNRISDTVIKQHPAGLIGMVLNIGQETIKAIPKLF